MAENLAHLKINPFYSAKDYTYPRSVQGSKFDIVKRNKSLHGKRIAKQLEAVRKQFDINAEEELPQNIVKDDVVYVEFFSDWNFPIKFESLNQETTAPLYQVVNIKQEKIEQDGESSTRFRVVVMMKKGAVSVFLKKVNAYLKEFTKDREGNITDKPVNQKLVANIEDIQLATIQSFWSDEPEYPFPQEDELVWWEVWFRKNHNEQGVQRAIDNLVSIGAVVGTQKLEFPEHTVKLVRATPKQLSASIMLLDVLSELRKPQQLNDFITHPSIDLQDKQLWQNDLIARTQFDINDNSVVICLLDSGVHNQHPLLSNVLPDEKLYTYKEAWGTEDSWDTGGHGTAMAGLSIYGDLAEVFATPNNIRIYHGLESFKIIHPNDPNNPELYGSITEFACSVPIIDSPNCPRIFCLAITDNQVPFHGRPSTWSASIDKIAAGKIENWEPTLFIISGGNVNYMQPHITPAHFNHFNLTESIHDPAQSYNALTVGTYTRMIGIDNALFPGRIPLAEDGGMSPSNSTSLMWNNEWPIKPEIVMEGGNLAVHGNTIVDNVGTLKPLSLDKDFNNFLFYPFGDTSGAAALASKLAAELKTAHPELWPETIRGLMVHSAEWTAKMLNGINLSEATRAQKRELLRTYGYGVPIEKKAFYSASNSLTLIAENSLQPYKLEGSSAKTNEYHLYDIPWPVDILQNQLTETDVKLTLTLSYFIEPNPGNKQFSINFPYHSHSLDFKLIKPAETLDEFKRRVSASGENEGVAYNGKEEPWALKEFVRNKGSIKKDFIVSSGADLATRNKIAIYPRQGWYKARKKFNKANSVVRYSLIVSIETEDVNIDIYTPVMNQIDILTLIE